MSARIITGRKRVTVVDHYHEFRLINDREAGFSFPVDDNGELLEDIHETAKNNFAHCSAHPEKYIDLGIVAYRRSYTENARAICECGKEIELWDQYQGASECPHCGQWHNLFGQSLIKPEYWEEEEYEEYCLI